MTVIKIKSDTTVNLTGTTPAQREILHDSTTNSLYLGDGTTTFASLTSVSGGGGGGGGITSLAQDTTPQLGGDLDAQSNDISSVGTITATSIVKSGGASSEFLKADGSVDTSTYITSVEDDGSPVLGGSLTLDQHDINVQAKNDSGSSISAGTPVYITGYHAGSSKPLIAPANASSASTMPAFGIVENTIADGVEGVVAVMGIVSGLDTTSPVSFSAGDIAYVASGGGLTNVKPTGVSEQIQNLGKVTKVHANGRILLLGAGRSNDVPNSGTFETLTVNDGIILPDSVPASTTNAVYNNGGTLYFNGSSLGGGGGGMTNLVDDTTPQLGGNLDLNSKDITGTGDIDITGSGHFSSNLTANSFIKDGGTSSQFLKADGSVDSSTYLTSETSHSDVLVDGDFSSQGIMLRGGSAGTYSILTDNSSNWNTAYGWGDHSAAGYATTSVTTLSSLSITKSQVSDLNTLTSHKLVDGAYTFPSALDSSSNKALFSDGSSAVEFATAPKSDISGITGTVSGVYNIVILDQTTYNNITTKDPNTIYFVP